MKGWKKFCLYKTYHLDNKKTIESTKVPHQLQHRFYFFSDELLYCKISVKIKYWQNVFNIWNCELHNWDIRCKYPNSLSYFPQINHQNISRINELTNRLTNSSADRNFKMLCKNWRSPQNHQPTSHSDRQQPKIRLGSVFSTNLFNKIHFWF